MGERSKIEWCDHTFNSWVGCSKVHAGCAHCYAESQFDTRRHVAQWGPHGTRVMTSPTYWLQPAKWDREAETAGERRLVFCASLADVFEDWPGQMSSARGPLVISETGEIILQSDHEIIMPGTRPLLLSDVREKLFALIDSTPHLTWLLLTKRPENIRRMWADGALVPNGDRCWPDNRRQNVWLGTSISDQVSADRQIPELLQCCDLAPVLFASVEPLLSEIELSGRHDERADSPTSYEHTNWLRGRCSNSPTHGARSDGARLNWVICGGESGLNARPMHPGWARSLRDQCVTAKVPFLFKQWGEWSSTGIRVGKNAAGRVLDGRMWDQYPDTD